MTQRVDRIAQLLNCPIKGKEIRQAILETRKELEAADDEPDDSQAMPTTADSRRDGEDDV
ncbi:hypothetical protein [Pseudomonas granadensis]|jgi:hypothetical protein|uniref:hypothetical protein n=1 Tax=Pseudomonas granadensis TaxID=1421430 RepID=UPI0008796FE0|nr:hypothetical protein [Pseudomonas granadensis]SDR79533.1 hypothetical protein SAMN05216496_0049 [Pseudomonas sp. Z003-0.4C(8344-21)]SDT65910.1 hypothetical protein SAMN05216579_5346 [Pseudomonas granadensis]